MEKMETNCKCDCPRALTRKERYENFRKDVNDSAQELYNVSGIGDVIKSINKLEKLMVDAKMDIQLQEVRGFVEDILGTIRAIKMRDSTRKDLLKLLGVTVERCDEILAEETHNEHVGRVRWFFQQCAEHAEDLSDFIDFSKLFGE